MTMLSSDIRSVPLAALSFSQTRAQAERREHFDKAGLAELAESIKSHGLVQPILVRPFRHECINGEAFEVVAGERRVLAARQAGLEEITATVRELTDEQVLELQLIENLQRQDLHELAEAEGYEGLQKLGHSIEDMAAKTGKSKATIYARMKLLALCQRGRDAFYDGKVSASIALLIARLPLEKWQLEALEHILQPWNGEHSKPLSYREASDYLQREYMLRLSEAPFPRDDETLVPSAGTCGACPKRTGNQPDIFGDVRGGDVCTDRLCFNQKRAAWNKLQLRDAKETGVPIISGAAAKKVKSPYSTELNGYVRPSDKCETDPKRRTYSELLGKEAKEVPSALLQNPESLRFSKVYKISDVAPILKKKGVTVVDRAAERDESNQRVNRRYEAEDAQREKKRKYHLALLQAIIKAAPAKLGRPELEAIANALFQNGYGDDEDLYKAIGLKYAKGTGFEQDIRKLSDADLNRTVFALTLWQHVSDSYGSGKASAELLAAAKRFKVDPDQVRKEHEAAEATATAKALAEKPAKAAKKKAARK